MSLALLYAGGKVASAVAGTLGAHKSIKANKKLYESQKKLMGERTKTAEQRYKWNEEEIMKDFTENYKKLSFDYGEKIRQVISEKAEVSSKLLSDASINTSNADMQGSSFLNSQMLELDQEFQNSAGKLIYQQGIAMSGLARSKEDSIRQNHLGMISSNQASTMETFQLKQDSEIKAANSKANVISGLSNIGLSSMAFKEELGLYGLLNNTKGSASKK
ncbi:MAG: hypothetical protein ACRC45_00650 [Cetobacterium sp.]